MQHSPPQPPELQVVPVANNKGGVGKTTTAVNLAAALHQLHGLRVLLVDMDPQANATQTLLGRSFTPEFHIGQGLMDKSLESVTMIAASGIHVAPAAFGLGQYETIIQQQPRWRHRLAQTLDTVRDQYDYVVIDCRPNLEQLTLMALVAATGYLIPTEPEVYALSGLANLTTVADGIVEALNPKLRLLGVTVTNYKRNDRTGILKKVQQALEMQYGKQALLPSIRHNPAAVVGSQAASKTIFEFAPDSAAAQDYAALTTSVIERLSTI